MKLIANGIAYDSFEEFLIKNRMKTTKPKEELMKNEVIRYFSQYWPDWMEKK